MQTGTAIVEDSMELPQKIKKKKKKNPQSYSPAIPLPVFIRRQKH